MTFAEAQAELYRVLAGKGAAPGRRDLLFAEVADLFLDHVGREKSAATADQYRYKLASAAKAFGRVKAADLKPSHVSRWLAENAWASATRRGAITTIKRALNFGVAEGMLDRNPLAHLERPRMTARTKTVSEGERAVIVEGKDPAFVDLVTALTETGCRVNEIARLTAKDVDWAGGTAEIRRKGHGEQMMPIYFTESMMALLRRLAEANPSGPLFLNSRGEPWTTNAVRCRFRVLRKAGKIDAKTTAHAFRRTFVTDGLEAGVSVAAMAELAGHADIKTTQAHYNRIAERRDHLRKAAELATARNRKAKGEPPPEG